MQELNPRAKNNPAGWRTAYDAFRAFRSIASKVGEPVDNWSLKHPSSLKEKLKGGWEITYTLNGTHYTAYVGYDASSATAGIKHMISVYPKHRRQTASTRMQSAKKPSILESPHLIVKLLTEWNAVISKVGKTISVEDYNRDYATHIKMLNMKAGVFPMNMQRYLTSHPHASYWPSPATSQEQADRRTQELREIVRQKELRARDERGYY